MMQGICLFRRLEAVVHAGETAVRLVAGDVQKFAFLFADWAGLWGNHLDYSVAAVAAFPSIFGKCRFIFRHGFPPVRKVLTVAVRERDASLLSLLQKLC
jgi:hypothetical protein